MRVRNDDWARSRDARVIKATAGSRPDGFAANWNRIGPGRVGDHLALALGIERHFADREPLAELDQSRLADEVGGLGSAQEIDRSAGGDRMRDAATSPRMATKSAASQTANIAGPEMVPPGRKCLG